MVIQNSKIVFGGWYQRTTMHLTEVFGFLNDKISRLDLDKEKLLEFHTNLGLKKVERKLDYLEYIEAIVENGIKIKYYEDGLYVLETDKKNLENDSNKLKNYFHTKLKPAIDYLFSLGAPTPKILANIKDEHPIVIGEIVANPKTKIIDEKIYGRIYSDIYSKNLRVLKTSKYIIILSSRKTQKELSNLIDMQIFFREFKDQLHKYLNIHRKMWEDIDDIRERIYIKGSDVGEKKSMLDSYQKTIQLIKNRINQMGSYAKTRSSLSQKLGVEGNLIDLFQYKYEDLFNSLDYIKEIWKMTNDYVNSAIKIIDDIKSEISENNLSSISFLVGVGVIAGIVEYFAPAKVPEIALSGILYVASFGVLAIILNKAFSWYGKRKKYEVNFIERSKNV